MQVNGMSLTEKIGNQVTMRVTVSARLYFAISLSLGPGLWGAMNAILSATSRIVTARIRATYSQFMSLVESSGEYALGEEKTWYHVAF